MPDKMVFLKNAADHKALIDQLELLDETVYKAAVLIAGTFRSGGKLIICGNGGSAADVEFEVRYHGDVTNFTLTPDTGMLVKGNPDVEAPVLTP